MAAVRATRLLELPGAFDLWQWAIGGPASKRRLVERAGLARGERVLDLGCGTGALLAWMPEGVEYVGVDVSATYVEAARRRYGQRGRFVRADAAELDAAELGRFDAAIAYGFLHHLDDADVRRVLDRLRVALRPGGRLLAAEPCHRPQAGRLETALMARDRGRFIRTREHYLSLAADAFPEVDGNVLPNELRIPYGFVLLTGRTALGDNGEGDG